MSRPLPPEILDHVVDQLYDNSTTLKTCCLVSKSWIRRTRKHLFANVSFNGLICDVESWEDTFPSPTNSQAPAHHTRTLSIHHPHLIGASDTILTFCNVERLYVITNIFLDSGISLAPLRGFSPALRSFYLPFSSIPASENFDFICSFPLLEDLAFAGLSSELRHGQWNAPPPPPDLTQTQRLPQDCECVRRDPVHHPAIARPSEWYPLHEDHSTMVL